MTDSTTRQANLFISTRDVGLTQVATISLNGETVIEFYTHTKRPEWSLEIAEQVLHDALVRSSFLSALEKNDCSEWRGRPGGTHLDDVTDEDFDLEWLRDQAE